MIDRGRYRVEALFSGGTEYYNHPLMGCGLLGNNRTPQC